MASTPDLGILTGSAFFSAESSDATCSMRSPCRSAELEHELDNHRRTHGDWRITMVPTGANLFSAPKLIAHRGGVVDGRRPENSLASLQEAIRRGYWMVEVDVRRSKDGEPVALHTMRLRRPFGVKGRVADLTWDELRRLRSRVDSQPPCALAELAACCRGTTRLMLDTKEERAQRGFFERMEQILLENGLLESAFFIGSAASKAYFRGKARVAARRETIEQSVSAGEPASDLYFLFAHGKVLDEETIQYARSLDVAVVASVNHFHYILPGRASPESDIRRLQELGVEYYQIDSDFESFFMEAK